MRKMHLGQILVAFASARTALGQVSRRTTGGHPAPHAPAHPPVHAAAANSAVHAPAGGPLVVKATEAVFWDGAQCKVMPLQGAIEVVNAKPAPAKGQHAPRDLAAMPRAAINPRNEDESVRHPHLDPRAGISHLFTGKKKCKESEELQVLSEETGYGPDRALSAIVSTIGNPKATISIGAGYTIANAVTVGGGLTIPIGLPTMLSIITTANFQRTWTSNAVLTCEFSLWPLPLPLA